MNSQQSSLPSFPASNTVHAPPSFANFSFSASFGRDPTLQERMNKGPRRANFNLPTVTPAPQIAPQVSNVGVMQNAAVPETVAADSPMEEAGQSDTSVLEGPSVDTQQPQTVTPNTNIGPSTLQPDLPDIWKYAEMVQNEWAAVERPLPTPTPNPIPKQGIDRSAEATSPAAPNNAPEASQRANQRDHKHGVTGGNYTPDSSLSEKGIIKKEEIKVESIKQEAQSPPLHPSAHSSGPARVGGQATLKSEEPTEKDVDHDHKHSHLIKVEPNDTPSNNPINHMDTHPGERSSSDVQNSAGVPNVNQSSLEPDSSDVRMAPPHQSATPNHFAIPPVSNSRQHEHGHSTVASNPVPLDSGLPRAGNLPPSLNTDTGVRVRPAGNQPSPIHNPSSNSKTSDTPRRDPSIRHREPSSHQMDSIRRRSPPGRSVRHLPQSSPRRLSDRIPADCYRPDRAVSPPPVNSRSNLRRGSPREFSSRTPSPGRYYDIPTRRGPRSPLRWNDSSNYQREYTSGPVYRRSRSRSRSPPPRWADRRYPEDRPPARQTRYDESRYAATSSYPSRQVNWDRSLSPRRYPRTSPHSPIRRDGWVSPASANWSTPLRQRSPPRSPPSQRRGSEGDLRRPRSPQPIRSRLQSALPAEVTDDSRHHDPAPAPAPKPPGPMEWEGNFTQERAVSNEQNTSTTVTNPDTAHRNPSHHRSQSTPMFEGSNQGIKRNRADMELETEVTGESLPIPDDPIPKKRKLDESTYVEVPIVERTEHKDGIPESMPSADPISVANTPTLDSTTKHPPVTQSTPVEEYSLPLAPVVPGSKDRILSRMSIPGQLSTLRETQTVSSVRPEDPDEHLRHPIERPPVVKRFPAPNASTTPRTSLAQRIYGVSTSTGTTTPNSESTSTSTPEPSTSSTTVGPGLLSRVSDMKLSAPVEFPESNDLLGRMSGVKPVHSIPGPDSPGTHQASLLGRIGFNQEASDGQSTSNDGIDTQPRQVTRARVSSGTEHDAASSILARVGPRADQMVLDRNDNTDERSLISRVPFGGNLADRLD